MSDKQTHKLTDVLSAALAKDWSKLSDKDAVVSAVADIITRLNTGDAALTALEQQPFPEARRVDWLVIYNEKARVEITCTFRAQTDAEVERRVAEFLARRGIETGEVWTSLDTKITNRQEAKMAQYQQQPRQDNAPATHRYEQPATGGVAQPEQWQHSGDGEVFMSPAVELLAMPKNKDGSELVWKVMTKQWQYAISFYDLEVASGRFSGIAEDLMQEYGIDVTDFYTYTEVNGKQKPSPAKYSLDGWTCHYIKNENGRPKKVVNLTR